MIFAFSGNPMTSALSTARHTTNHPELNVAISSKYLKIFRISFNDYIQISLLLPAHFHDAAGDLFTIVQKLWNCPKFWQCSCKIVICSCFTRVML